MMITLMGGAFDAVASTTQTTEQSEVAKKRRPKKKKKRGYSSHHGWKNVSTGRTCNKKRRR